jgi:phosphoglycolate phosphatase
VATYIFDFDGTIADSFSLVCDILFKHAKYLRCKQLTPTEIVLLREMHAREVLKYLGVPFWRAAAFVQKLRKIGNLRVDEINIFPEWPMILKQLSDNQHKIGIISSNSHKTVAYILKKHGLYESFEFIFCDTSLFGKKRCLNKLIKQQNLNRTDTYYVGDEVRDIEASQANKIHSIAVSWGFNSVIKLKEANPEKLIMDINQLNDCMK